MWRGKRSLDKMDQFDSSNSSVGSYHLPLSFQFSRFRKGYFQNIYELQQALINVDQKYIKCMNEVKKNISRSYWPRHSLWENDFIS